MPVHCKLVNKLRRVEVLRGHALAYIVVVNSQDTKCFNSLFDSSPSTMGPGAPSLEQLQDHKIPIPQHELHKQVRVEDAS